MRILIVLILAMMLSGCAGGGMVPISSETVDTVVGGATTTMGYITDASAIKELAVHKTLQNRDKMVRDAHKDSGMSVGWQAVEETVFYPGMKEPMVITRYLPTISYKEKAEFKQNLPTVPSEHPGWRVAENVATAAIRGTVIGIGLNAASEVLQSSIDNAGHNSSIIQEDNSVTTIDKSTGPVDNSVGPVDNSVGPVDNSVGPVDNSNQPVDNSIGPVDNRVGPVDNSVELREEVNEDN